MVRKGGAESEAGAKDDVTRPFVSIRMHGIDYKPESLAQALVEDRKLVKVLGAGSAEAPHVGKNVPYLHYTALHIQYRRPEGL
jgi:hypothetical protein